MKERTYNPEKVSYVDYGFSHPSKMVTVAYANEIIIWIGIGQDNPRKYRVLNMDNVNKRFLLESVYSKRQRDVTFSEVSYAARVK